MTKKKALSEQEGRWAKEDAEWRAERIRLLREARDANCLAWEERDKFNPANWFRIPNFDVLPAEVDFEGFEGPVFYFWNPDVAKPVRELLRVARTLLKRAGVLSMWDMYARLDEAFEIEEKYMDNDGAKGHEHFSEQQRAAMLYFISTNYLRDFTTRRNGSSDEDVLNLANAAEWISAWALEGTAAALESMQSRGEWLREIGAKGGKKSAEEREKKVNSAKVIEAARQRGWPARDWGIRSVLAKKFSCSPQRIGQILLKAAQETESRK